MMRLWPAILLLSGLLAAQSPYQETYAKKYFRGEYPQKIPVLFAAYPCYQPESKTFAVYFPVQIKNSFLQFIRDNDVYRATAEIEILVSAVDGRVRRTRIWETGIVAASFEETHDRHRFHFTADSLHLQPGHYEVRLKYHDLNGQQGLSMLRKLNLRITDSLYIAPPLFVEPERTPHKLFPFVAGRPSPLKDFWDFDRPLHLLLQVWRSAGSTPLPCRLELLDEDRNRVLMKKDTTLAIADRPVFWQVNLAGGQLNRGRHRLKIVYYSGVDSIRQIVPFEVMWFNRPISLWDAQLTLEPLRYIMKRDAYEQLAAGDREARREKLAAFWRNLDPTPDTPFNELEAEFYSRVDSTLSRFSTKRELGWKTDPGRIYIAHGPPHEIEDLSLAPLPTPYLRWVYVEDDKRTIYTFRAVNGRKEYELAGTREEGMKGP